MLLPRTSQDLPAVNFPPFFPLQSPPLIPGLGQRFPAHPGAGASHSPSFSEEPHTSGSDKCGGQKKAEMKATNGKQSSSSMVSLKVECGEPETSSAPLDLTHRSPNSATSEDADTEQKDKREHSSKDSSSSSPEHKLGTDIEEHLTFLKVKQMEFLKQAAESAQNRCNECNINFSKYQNYVAHKKYYCSGLSKQQGQDSDEESSPPPQAAAAQGKKSTPLPSPSSPQFSPSSQNIAMAAKQNMFNQEFFLNQKSLIENFPGKMPLLMTPPVLQPNTSHFICQGCGIKFKSISNLKAHQSRYCSGIKSTEEAASPSPVNPNLEALLKSQLAGVSQGAAGPGLPLQGLSAADMITLLSAQHMAAAKTLEQEAAAASKKTPGSPPSLVQARAKSPKHESSSASSSSLTASEQAKSDKDKEDFCLVLCGFKESAVDLNKLKEQFNMQFIGQVNNKRKSGNDGDEDEDDSSSRIKEVSAKKLKNDDLAKNIETENNPQHVLDVKKESDDATKEAMKCPNCNISFVNAATFQAHVSFYCKKRAIEQN